MVKGQFTTVKVPRVTAPIVSPGRFCGGIRELYGDFVTNFIPCSGGYVGTLSVR